jgi:hypothetical protein
MQSQLSLVPSRHPIYDKLVKKVKEEVFWPQVRDGLSARDVRTGGELITSL